MDTRRGNAKANDWLHALFPQDVSKDFPKGLLLIPREDNLKCSCTHEQFQEISKLLSFRTGKEVKLSLQQALEPHRAVRRGRSRNL